MTGQFVDYIPAIEYGSLPNEASKTNRPATFELLQGKVRMQGTQFMLLC